jgi:L-threonylcarbamoyladenylate synthase
MQTLVTEDPEVAAAVLRSGGLVAFPTETVYGLGGDATSPAAIARIFRVKGRPSDNPLIVHVAEAAQLAEVAAEITPLAAALLERFAPGPITVVVRRHGSLCPAVSAGLDSVGVRIPDLDLARAFLRAAGRPVAAPSANRSGTPSPTRAAHVVHELGGQIEAVLIGPDCRIGLESTVVDARGTTPVVLREGGVTFEALRDVFPAARIAGSGDPLHDSPGTRHRHYAPKAKILLVSARLSGPIRAGTHGGAGSSGSSPPCGAAASVTTYDQGGVPRAWIGLHEPPDDATVMGAGAPRPHAFDMVHVASDVDAYARVLFDFWRRCDTAGIEVIHCEWPPCEGLGSALRDRLLRAARG